MGRRKLVRFRISHLPGAYPSHLLRQPPVDLFGEVAVTTDDCYEWVARVSPVHTADRALARYVREYGVIGKITRAKLRGDWWPLMDTPQREPMCNILSMLWRT
jgi:hypothetical protein